MKIIYEDILRKFLPLNILQLKKGHGSFLTINLIDEQNGVKYILWVYLCDWYFYSLESQTKLLTSDEVSIENNSFLESFKKCDINSIEFINKEKIEFRFSNHTTLVLEANLDYYDEDDDLFILFKKDNAIINYTHQDGLIVI